MLWVLLKKQIAEVFKSYFYDAKKNKMRSKGAIALWIIFFVVVMVVILGGMFTALSLSLCGGLVTVGKGWMYFLLMGGIGIVLGAFGSVFNTYVGLYLGKDNDLLFSLPIPVRTILTARLANVYLLGAIYSATVMIPTLIVYWVLFGATAPHVICGLLLFLVVTFIVLILSCLLGWVIAKISLKLKNKSFITVLVSLLFIGAYYFFYFKARDLIGDILLNAEAYGERIRGTAYGLYLFGRVGEGDWLATAIVVLVTAAVFALVCYVLARSFLRVATASGSTGKVRYTEKAVRERSVFGAFFGKELARFTGSANYMLNCGFGVLILLIGGVLLLIKGQEVFEALNDVFAARQGSSAVLICTMLCLMAAMNDTAAPSVSLEGKSLWLPQVLPVEAKTALRAKNSVQLVITAAPMLFAAVCAALSAQADPAERLLIVVMPLAYTAFAAALDTVIGVNMPLLTWTNELVPIKQSGAVAIALFGGWAVCAVFGGVYLLVGYTIGAALYLLIWTVLLAAAALIMLRWLDTKGAAIFAAL